MSAYDGLQENPIAAGILMIHMYVPERMIPEDLMDRPLDEFWKLVAAARFCRERRQEDIQAGVAMAFSTDDE